jgi:predicted PurR-regulated permease PerM
MDISQRKGSFWEKLSESVDEVVSAVVSAVVEVMNFLIGIPLTVFDKLEEWFPRTFPRTMWALFSVGMGFLIFYGWKDVFGPIFYAILLGLLVWASYRLLEKILPHSSFKALIKLFQYMGLKLFQLCAILFLLAHILILPLTIWSECSSSRAAQYVREILDTLPEYDAARRP